MQKKNQLPLNTNPTVVLLGRSLILLVLFMFSALPFFSRVWGDRSMGGELVIFNANWCASCRDVLPLVQDIAASNHLELTTIDVDAHTAAKDARILGLSLPKEGPPQVYYVHKRKTVLLYSGENYKFGYNTQIRATILQNLQQALP